METEFEEEEQPKRNTKRDALIAKILWGLAIMGTVTIMLPIGAQLLSNKPQKLGEPIVIQPPAESINIPGKNDSIARNEAWRLVQATCLTGLQAEFSNTDRELELGRAQRWQVEARVQSAKQKITEYEWLTNAYLAYAEKLQEFTKSGQFPTNANAAAKYRELRGIIADIATALSTSGAALRPSIVSEDLNTAVDNCYESTIAYQNLRSNRTEEIGGNKPLGETP